MVGRDGVVVLKVLNASSLQITANSNPILMSSALPFYGVLSPDKELVASFDPVSSRFLSLSLSLN